MPEVLFYHLTERPLESASPDILEKCLERGWRVTLRAGSEERARALDVHYWTYRDESFLPHGMAGDGPPEKQFWGGSLAHFRDPAGNTLTLLG